MMVYTRAPISEVICGVFFPRSVFSADDISRFNVLFLQDYPNREFLPPICLEMLINKQIRRLTPSGPAVISLTRRLSTDKHFLVQFQENCFYLNWIRSDGEDVGKYPRFVNIFDRFLKEFKKVNDIKNLNEFIPEAFFELTYCDRFYLADEKEKRNITDYISLNLPAVLKDEADSKIDLRFSIEEKNLGGSAFLEVSTNYDSYNRELSDFRYIIRGTSAQGDLEKWFSVAHERQLEVFDISFTNKAKEMWK